MSHTCTTLSCMGTHLRRPDCPCCVADFLGIACSTTDTVSTGGDDFVESLSKGHTLELFLVCAVGLAICILCGCAWRITWEVRRVCMFSPTSHRRCLLVLAHPGNQIESRVSHPARQSYELKSRHFCSCIGSLLLLCRQIVNASHAADPFIRVCFCFGGGARQIFFTVLDDLSHVRLHKRNMPSFTLVSKRLRCFASLFYCLVALRSQCLRGASTFNRLRCGTAID